MAFELPRIRQELEAMPPATPFDAPLAIAVVADVVRLGGAEPPANDTWITMLCEADLREEQLAVLAWLLQAPALRDESVRTIATVHPPPSQVLERLQAFFASVAPLTAEMVKQNAFRQEEMVRRWIEAWAGEVAGEKPEQSQRRLQQLDYRKTQAAFEKAEKARAEEAARRAEALRVAAEAEAAARGWRE